MLTQDGERGQVVRHHLNILDSTCYTFLKKVINTQGSSQGQMSGNSCAFGGMTNMLFTIPQNPVISVKIL